MANRFWRMAGDRAACSEQFESFTLSYTSLLAFKRTWNSITTPLANAQRGGSS